MRQQRILLVAPPSVSPKVRERLGASIVGAWPRVGRRPSIVNVEFEHLPEALVERPIAQLAVAVLDESEGRPGVARLIDDLIAARTAGLILLPGDLASTARDLEAEGVLIESWDSDPATLAAALHALCQRECMIERLSRELNLTRAAHGGLSGQMAQLHEELNLASSVQRELMPRELPRVEGLDLGVLFRPAGFVSGDVYDCVRIGERRVAFLLADAVGHGVPAALLTMVISRSLRRTLDDAGPSGNVDPADAMRRLNRDLCGAGAGSFQFATAVFGVVDSETWEVTASVAGHPSPLRLRAGTVDRVPADGPLLGVFEAAEFEQSRFRLAPGETLLIYSDGFETAFPTGGDRRLLGKPTSAYLRHLGSLGNRAEATGSVGAALLELTGLLDAQSGSLHQRDDVTALAIRRTDAAAVHHRAAA
ncbi:MAG TPA: SpoIIE family protein phosphatase [Phycisphaerales bacterium]|nr:SpoIIE family protein phosphatase [Phycisphaerales bacterium]